MRSVGKQEEEIVALGFSKNVSVMSDMSFSFSEPIGGERKLME